MSMRVRRNGRLADVEMWKGIRGRVECQIITSHSHRHRPDAQIAMYVFCFTG
ncbi:hypothetical protein ZOSMA_150G00380 [Zostera marina]|uniref:Uncharacterized protein n=1 Tax=Zostera marina TaxID=29655 RepID=A0A0K9PYE0_ZOSMR|nr:hypothetical protein ZOSMA_150G00380 [Zostera marina]